MLVSLFFPVGKRNMSKQHRGRNHPSARSQSNKSEKSRFFRPLLERLEDRTLLAALTSTQAQELTQGLQSLTQWSQRLEGFDQLTRPVAILSDASTGQAL